MGKRKPPPTTEELKNMLWKDYIKSRHWVSFRKTINMQDDCVCEICLKPKWGFYKVGAKKGQRKPKPLMQFHLHHLNYNHLAEETREDVLLLCAQCHNFFHDAERMNRTRKGVFSEIYEILLKETSWEYSPFKDRNK